MRHLSELVLGCYQYVYRHCPTDLEISYFSWFISSGLLCTVLKPGRGGSSAMPGRAAAPGALAAAAAYAATASLATRHCRPSRRRQHAAAAQAAAAHAPPLRAPPPPQLREALRPSPPLPASGRAADPPLPCHSSPTPPRLRLCGSVGVTCVCDPASRRPRALLRDPCRAPERLGVIESLRHRQLHLPLTKLNSEL